MQLIVGYVYAPSPSWAVFIGTSSPRTDSPKDFKDMLVPFPTLAEANDVCDRFSDRWDNDDGDCGVDILRIELAIPESSGDLAEFAHSQSLVLIGKDIHGGAFFLGAPGRWGYERQLRADVSAAFFPQNDQARFKSLAAARHAQTAIAFLDSNWCLATCIARLHFRLVGGDAWDELLEKRYVARERGKAQP